MDLGRHVLERPDHLAGAGDPRGVDGLRDPEVGEPSPAVALEEDVRWLHVAVHDACAMDAGQRAQQLPRQPASVDLARHAGRDPVGERSSLDVLHHQVGALRLAGEVEDLDQVRV